MSLVRRSSSASIPTEERTVLMSSTEGDSFPAMPRRRKAAMCFILEVVIYLIVRWSAEGHSKQKDKMNDQYVQKFYRTGESIDLTASWAETETSSSLEDG